MSLHQFTVLGLAVLVAMATPGPGVFAVVSRSLVLDWRCNLGFILGMALGDLAYFTLAAAGFAALAQAFGPVFVALRYAAALYLVWLGTKAWRATVRDASLATVEAAPGHRQLASGLTVTLSNPKAITFYLALLPAVLDLNGLTLADGMAVAAMVAGLRLTVMLSYALAASRARSLFRSPRALKGLNRGAGTVMVSAGIAIATT